MIQGLAYSSFEDVLRRHGQLVYPNKGGSMLPLLREGRDLAVIRSRLIDKDGHPLRCQKYDVVLYKRGNKYILHRILKVLPHGYVICGDNNYCREYDIDDDQIIGVLTGFVRGGVETSVTDYRYRIYVHLWCDFFPLRAGIIWVRTVMYRIKRKLIS